MSHSTDALVDWLGSIDTYVRGYYDLDDCYPRSVSLSRAAVELYFAFLKRPPAPASVSAPMRGASSSREAQLYLMTAYGLCLKFWVDINDNIRFNTLLARAAHNMFSKKEFSNAEWDMLVALDLNIRGHTELQFDAP